MSRSRPTQQQPGTYTPEQQPALMMAASHAGVSQLLAAADLVSQVFQANSIPYAFMGGFALKIRGSTRDTHDVDVAVECTMQRLIQVLSGQPRVRRPAGPTSGVMRAFVYVGGQWNPGVPELWVAVDMIFRGSLGAPDHLQNAVEILPMNTGAGPKGVLVIDIVNAMASKLNAFISRQKATDYDDIFFLVMNYGNQVFAIRTQLNAAHCQYFFTAFEQRNTQEAITYVKGVLGIP